MPATNTDGTRPANISRVDVYAITGAGHLAADRRGSAEARDQGRRVSPVKAPRDPDRTAEPGEPPEEVEPPEGTGLDQGAVVAPEGTAYGGRW